MKQIQMEYQDGSIHNILVTDYYNNPEKDVDFIEYYDNTTNKDNHAILKNIKGKIYKDTDYQDYSYNELIKNKKEKRIEDLPDYIESIKSNTKNPNYDLEFDVYETESGLFIASTIAEAFHLNKKYRNKKINNIICVPVTEDEIKRIEIISGQGIPSLKAKIVKENKNKFQMQGEFNVYHIEEVNKYFAFEDICNKYKVGTGTHYINGKQCKEVTYDDIKLIEEKSLYDNYSLKAKFNNLSFKKEKIEIFVNNKNNKLYIKNDICTKYNIGTGFHYIDNHLYKEVTAKEISKLSNEDIDYKYLKFTKSIKQFVVYVDEYSNRYFVENNIGDFLGIGGGIHYIGDKQCREITIKEIKDIVESSMYNEIKYEPNYVFLKFNNTTELTTKKKEKEPIKITDVYRDKNNNNKLYVKKEDCDKYNIGNKASFKYINNNECYEISLIDLTKIKKPNLKTVYLLKEVNYEIVNENKQTFLVCKYEDILFINKTIAKTYNINYSSMIIVEGEEFVQVSEESINEIEKLSNLVRKEVIIQPTNDNDEVLDLEEDENKRIK